MPQTENGTIYFDRGSYIKLAFAGLLVPVIAAVAVLWLTGNLLLWQNGWPAMQHSPAFWVAAALIVIGVLLFLRNLFVALRIGGKRRYVNKKQSG